MGTECENGEFLEAAFDIEMDRFTVRRIAIPGVTVVYHVLPDSWERVDGKLKFTGQEMTKALLKKRLVSPEVSRSKQKKRARSISF